MEALHPAPDKLAAYALQHLGEADREQLERHLQHCSACRALLTHLPPKAMVSLAVTRIPSHNPLHIGIFPPDAAPTVDYHTLPTDKLAAADPLLAPALPPPELAYHPRYRILGLLGAGGMGVVYKAEHRMMERTVALKVIHPKLVNHVGMVERFHREVRAAARLDHPNIVSAFDAEQAGATHFLVMEFIEGADLEKIATSLGQLPLRLACGHARQVARGLQHAFERGMVHRDIKPHNIMITPLGQVKILDFGLARFVSESAVAPETTAPSAPISTGLTLAPTGTDTGFGWVMGTVDYLAPEEAKVARLADIRADLYSLGCVLYRLLAGQVLFPEGSAEDKIRAHLERRPVPLEKLRPDLPSAFTRIVARLIAKDPQHRFQTPLEVVDALEPFTT